MREHLRTLYAFTKLPLISVVPVYEEKHATNDMASNRCGVLFFYLIMEMKYLKTSSLRLIPVNEQ